MQKTRIEWTDCVLNPITGCSPISEGCQNCYAKVMARRLKAMGLKKYENEFKVTYHPEELAKPIPGKGKKIFIGSMTDVFHDDVKPEWIRDIFDFAMCNPQHTFLLLTKRPENIAAKMVNANVFREAKNVWIGVTVENQKHAGRIKTLRESWSGNKFISMEPLLDDVSFAPELNLFDIGWIIAGAETGPKARNMQPKWAHNMARTCQCCGIPFFFKKWSKNNVSIIEMPRQFPREMEAVL